MQDARNLLATTALWGEAYKDLDVQHQHHVTIFLGIFFCFVIVGVVSMGPSF